jgi:hypothetical protein
MNMILDYSQPKRRGLTLACCIRTLWSPTARVEFAQSATCAHAICVLAVISALAAFLTASSFGLHSSVVRGMGPKAGSTQWIFNELLGARDSWGRLALQLIPGYFAALGGVVYIIAHFWSRCGGWQSWTRCFSAVSIGAVPLLWFFLLLQANSLAPLVEYEDLWHHYLNPLTNSVRFATFLGSMMLIAIWVLEAAKLRESVRFQR